jgi:hypothetical protein
MEDQVKDNHWYEIEIQGQLGQQWSRAFQGLEIKKLANGRTILYGKALDQSALFGVLQRIRDLGTPLLSVTRCDPPSGDKQP